MNNVVQPLHGRAELQPGFLATPSRVSSHLNREPTDRAVPCLCYQRQTDTSQLPFGTGTRPAVLSKPMFCNCKVYQCGDGF